MNDEREAKLPRWAQEELRHLRMRLNEAEDAFFKAFQKPNMDSDIIINPYSLHAHTVIGRPNIGFRLRRMVDATESSNSVSIRQGDR